MTCTCGSGTSSPWTASRWTSQPGEILGLVGDSGCGKTTLARVIVGLGEAGSRARDRRRRDSPRRDAPADACSSSSRTRSPALSPRLTIGQTLEEPLLVAGWRHRGSRVARVEQLLELVGLPSALAARRPRALSGGQRQRVGIARALASAPDVLVCDEPVSSLDASVRAQVMNVLLDLREAARAQCAADRARSRAGAPGVRSRARHASGSAPASVTISASASRRPTAKPPGARCRSGPRARTRGRAPARARTRSTAAAGRAMPSTGSAATPTIEATVSASSARSGTLTTP